MCDPPKRLEKYFSYSQLWRPGVYRSWLTEEILPRPRSPCDPLTNPWLRPTTYLLLFAVRRLRLRVASDGCFGLFLFIFFPVCVYFVLVKFVLLFRYFNNRRRQCYRGAKFRQFTSLQCIYTDNIDLTGEDLSAR